MALWGEILHRARPANQARSWEPSSEAAARARGHIRKTSAWLQAPGGIQEMPMEVRTSLVGLLNELRMPAERVWLCGLLAEELGVHGHAVEDALQCWKQARQGPHANDYQQLRIANRLSDSLQPIYMRLFHLMAQERDGIRLLVQLRADVLEHLALQPAYGERLRAFADHLRRMLASWFSPGLLECTPIKWTSSANILEKVMKYEAVHPMSGWHDLQRRVSSTDRRVYAFFHPVLPGEPLVILHSAIGLGPPAKHLQPLLSPTPHQQVTQQSLLTADSEQAEPDTALFYSISATQRGLQGVELGQFLIKQVADLIKGEFPTIQTFATLSPIPGFRQWLFVQLCAEDVSHRKPHSQDKEQATQQHEQQHHHHLPPIVTPEEAAELLRASALLPGMTSGQQGCIGTGSSKASHDSGSDAAQGNPLAILAMFLRDDTWRVAAVQDPKLGCLFQRLLLRAAARYVVLEKRRNLALDAVAHFHLRNGAHVGEINWQSDMSERGMERSFGMMVNYVYDLARVHDNNKAYVLNQQVHASDSVKGVLSG